MSSHTLTFEILALSRNESADDVLMTALVNTDPEVRSLALKALLRRPDPNAAPMVLRVWQDLQSTDLAILKANSKWMHGTIETVLRDGGDLLPQALEAAETLALTHQLQRLIVLAESSGKRSIRLRASQVVLALVEPLGHAARTDRDRATVRGPILERLADSVRRFSMHRNGLLVDAFLLVATWSDNELRKMTAEDPGNLELVADRLAKSTQLGVIELLAGFIRRRNPLPKLIELMQTREDAEFRDALLRKIGHEPTSTVQRNLRDMGIPKSCEGGQQVFGELPLDCRAAYIYLQGAANVNHIELLHLIVSAVQCGGPGCELAAAVELSRCEVPDIEFWMRAAVPVADGNDEVIACDENARLLQGLIDLLDHSEASLVRGVRRVLEPLHADAMLHKFQALRPRSRRRLGRVVLMIDPGAINRVRDALRHPVLEHRLEAIAMADALAIVDLLSDSFAHISREDHQQARIRAADVMADANGDETLRLLEEMINLPESPVRDAAVIAIDRRQKAVTR